MLGARWRTSDFYWERAEEIQALCDRTRDPDTRHELSILAEQFRRMAEFVELRHAAPRPPMRLPSASASDDDDNVTDLSLYRAARARNGEKIW
ncbi:MAG TPA: hypothetical protein VFA12_02370 [Stellaceae bacterium]|nr:hypothetical protein [Stellaceae bacterium]